MREWESRPLRDLVAFQKGRKVPVSAYPRIGYEPYLGAGVLAGDEPSEFADTAGAVTASSSDVLMLWDGERSGLTAAGNSGVVASTVGRLSPQAAVVPALLAYLLQSRFDWIQARRTGTGVPHVPKDLGRILVLRYPAHKEEQRCIAEILSTVDDAIEQTEALIEKTQAIKAGLMHDLFTRGVLPNGQLRPLREQAPELYKPSPLGWIPGDWEAVDLGRVVERAVYGISVALDDRRGTPVLRMNNLRDGGADVADLKYSSSVLARGLLLRAGDVLFNRTNSMEHVGRTGIWRGQLPEASFASYLVRLEPITARLSNEFLNAWLNWPRTQIRIRRFATPGVHQVNINPTNLCRTQIALPRRVEEQSLIVSVLDRSARALRENYGELEKLRDLKQGLMHDLLTGDVPVPTCGGSTHAAPAETASA